MLFYSYHPFHRSGQNRRNDMSKNKHLILNERYKIEHGLDKKLSFKAIAKDVDKDCSTISKEIRTHIIFERKGAPYRPFNDCLHRTNCLHNGDVCHDCIRKKSNCALCGRCVSFCSDYIKETCTFLLRPPYVCNGCDNLSKCTLEKRFYKALSAQKEYEAVRTEARSGFNLSEQEIKQLDSIISPLLKNGQSLHHILTNNPDTISCCEKTAYVYADNGLFTAKNIDMPRKVRFKPRKKKSVPLKVDKACRIERTYQDFLNYRQHYPSLPVVQLDSVEGIKGGSVLLTIHFVLPKLQLAFLRKANDSRSVIDIFDQLFLSLGDNLFQKIFPLCLADNGTEFSNPKAIEYTADGHLRTHLFYCNPSAPNQKGACENNHEFIRRIIPKGIDIGIYEQQDISLMMDHINSYSRPELGDKSPYEMFEFYYGRDILELLGVKQIPANEIILKPSLLCKK